MESLSIFICSISAIIFGVYFFTKWRYSYWKRRGVYYLEPTFPFGNVKELATRKQFFGDTFHDIYKQFKAKGVKGGGYYMFLKPMYMPIDLELIKDILQKDFGHFVNRGRYVNKEVDPLSGNLFSIENDEWRNLRIKLTPTFTSAKMKMMFQTFVACTDTLIEVLNQHATIKDPVEIKDVVSRFTTDIIGSCAFGIDCNSLKNPSSEFRNFGKKIFDTTLKNLIRNILVLALPNNLLTLLRIKQLDEGVSDFFMGVVRDTVSYRERNNIVRNDFMQLLLQLKNKGKLDDEDDAKEEDDNSHQHRSMSMEDMAAQCFVFFFAGFDTSSSTMTFALLELAIHQNMQDKLRDEIETVLQKHGGTIRYETVMEMSYLDQIVNETLRKHAPASAILRSCNKAYQIPGTDIILEPGTQIRIATLGIHNDSEYYPDPDKFDPDRFSEENKAKRSPFSFLAFGEGPRNCIGARFGLLQTKVGIITIIKNFKVTLNNKTKIPIKHEPYNIIATVEGGVWLNINKLRSD